MLRYFAGRGGFHVVVADVSVQSFLGGLNFDILWPAPWLCSCYIRHYSKYAGFLVLFTDLLVGE
jgi:hypothetical protein